MMIWLAVLDGAGVYGSVLHYAFVISFAGNAFLIFIYLWCKNKLNMDEEAKFQMMEDKIIHAKENNESQQ
ncbi:MAG: hypothetical protein Q8K60_01870 [Parachlamydiaceae bacterium]|nr:hypothetical protein [Parachlamydiaceae bacterium]